MFDGYLEDVFWCFETDLLFYGKIIGIISTKLKINRKKIAKAVVLFSCFLLIHPNTAKYTSNVILLIPVITISLFSSFNKIEFDKNDIFVYWSLYSILSLLDSLFEKLTPLYYFLKVFIISITYLRPFKYGYILRKMVMRKINIIGKFTECSVNEKINSYTKLTESSQLITAISDSISSSSKFKEFENQLSKSNSKIKISNNSTYSTKKSKNILYASAGDIAFSVDKYLFFSKSFTREISENVYVKNLNLSNPIIFNIKSNVPNYISANPGRGVIESDETLIINILLKPIPSNLKLNSFIVVIEYNIAPIGTKNFSSQFIDGRYRKIFKLRHY